MRASQTFVLALRRPRLKSLPSDLVYRQIASDIVPKACLKSRAKKIPKSVEARTHPCLTSLRMSKGLEELPLNCTVPFMLVWKDSIMLCNRGGQPIFGRIWKRPSLLTRSNAFVRSMKAIYGASVVLSTSSGVGEGRRPCLLLIFQLGSHTVIQVRMDTFCQLLQSDQDDLCKDFANDAEKGDASVVVALFLKSVMILASLMSCGTAPCQHWQRSTCRECSEVVMQCCSRSGGSRRYQGPCQRPNCQWPW